MIKSMKLLKIGKLKLKNPLILAPMVDVTDLPYRLICRRAGASLAFTEMLYIDAILHDNRKTLNLMKTNKEDRPIGLQITGNSEEEFKKFVESKKWKNFDLIDLNCGCPSLRITGSEAGSFLLKNPEKIARMIEILRKTGKVVTAKIRLGFRKNNVLQVAREIEKAGADAVTVHSRLAFQGRDVPADWSWIKKVKNEVKIPVIGNGDIFSGKDARKILEICDGAMIARGAIGDPLIFERGLRYLESGVEEGELNVERNLRYLGNSTRLRRVNDKTRSACDINKKTSIDREELSAGDVKKNLRLFLEYLRLERDIYGEDVELSRIKYVGGRFLRGFVGAGKKREELMKARSLEEIEKFVCDLN